MVEEFTGAIRNKISAENKNVLNRDIDMGELSKALQKMKRNVSTPSYVRKRGFLKFDFFWFVSILD